MLIMNVYYPTLLGERLRLFCKISSSLFRRGGHHFHAKIRFRGPASGSAAPADGQRGGSAAQRPMHPRLTTFHIGKFDQRVIKLTRWW